MPDRRQLITGVKFFCIRNLTAAPPWKPHTANTNSIWANVCSLGRPQSKANWRRAQIKRWHVLFYDAVGGDLIKRGTSALFTHSLARAARRSYLSAISYFAALAAGSSILSANRRASSARKCQCIGSVSNSGTGSPLLTLRHPPLDFEALDDLARAAGPGKDFGFRGFQSTDHAMYLVIKNVGRLENAARQIGTHMGRTNELFASSCEAERNDASAF